jgi:two-component system chemotaxis sensor kinase CheA
LDKTVIDGLMNPLMHILRNSLDHGLESVNERMSKGKNPKGTIAFSAFYSGTNVIIQVKDDGKGIDLEKVRAKGIEKEMISEDSQLSERELLQLLFAPGFSTAKTVSAVSGRGVGMDVVNREISDIRGKIDINTQKDKGTVISLSLPLTLSIIDSLHVRVKHSNFLIPLSLVDRCGDIPHSDLINAANKKIPENEQLIPFVYLRDEFRIKGEAPIKEKTVIVKYEDHEVALIVDSIIGEHQTVLKPLGEIFKDQDIFSGGSILGDGTLAIVLDTNKLIEGYALQNENFLKSLKDNNIIV